MLQNTIYTRESPKPASTKSELHNLEDEDTTSLHYELLRLRLRALLRTALTSRASVFHRHVALHQPDAAAFSLHHARGRRHGDRGGHHARRLQLGLLERGVGVLPGARLAVVLGLESMCRAVCVCESQSE